MKHQRYVMLAFVVGSVLAGIAVDAASVSAFAATGTPNAQIAGLISYSVALSVMFSFMMFFILIRSASAVEFSDQVVGELFRVTWPSKDETVSASTTVVVTTIFVASVIGVYDVIWNFVASIFLFAGN